MPYESAAVLYRTNAQSRQIEEIFRRDRIPYHIVGSVQFYERKEIKDLLAYLKLVANPNDDVAFRRVVNTPPRGIGATTIRLVEEVRRAMNLPLIAAAAHALAQGVLSPRSAAQLQRFLDLVSDLSARAEDGTVAGLIEDLIEAIDYRDYLEKAFGVQFEERMENARALVSAAVEYAEEEDESYLRGFLDRSALVAQADDVGGRPGVTLMTIHCAKGLEFPLVFLVGLEEQLFPHAMSNDSIEEIEEERRLCYVAMTRAKQRLFLSHALRRRVQGAMIPTRPSRFLAEVPSRLTRRIAAPRGDGERTFFDNPVGTERFSEGSSAARPAARRKLSPPPIGRQSGVDPGDGFRVGSTVLHPSFGSGRILDREGAGMNLKLTIHFTNHGAKKILPGYTKLKVQVG